MTITLPLDLLIEIVLLAAGVAGAWMLMRAEVRDLRRQIEAHGPDVRKINPLETRFDAFRSEVERRLGGIEAKVEDVHALLLKAASRA